MGLKKPDVQPLDVRGVTFTVAAILVAALYQGLWYVAPNFLALPLWQGATLSVAFLLGSLALAAPVILAWLAIRFDDANSSETFETSGH